MYNSFKRLVLSLFPKMFLYKNEILLRYPLYLAKYKGNKFKCNICNSRLNHFIAQKEDKLCPACGSLQRTRLLWHLLSTEFLQNNISILHFSPSRSIYRKLKKLKTVEYISSDLSGNFIADKSYNITDINAPSESFNLIICYHILEHIEQDQKAMDELFRVLKTGGKCLIQTPFKKGEIYEDSSITAPEEREKKFGQNDHVRIYSVEGLKERLEKSGFKVKVRSNTETSDNYFGFANAETILVCEK